MLTEILCAKCVGIDAIPVTVEVDVTAGIGIHLVGLADAAVKESLLRTMTALQSRGFRIPGKKIVINLAPADTRKNGSGYDLPIALGIIAASGQAELPLMDRFLIMGELGLDGTLRDIPGVLPIVDFAASMGRGCILPAACAQEAAEFAACPVYGASDLGEVINILKGKTDCSSLLVRPPHRMESPGGFSDAAVDFSDIIGQEAAKRGLEIAAAGGHNVLLVGPPGSGKSSLAKALPGILPPMTLEESVQTSKIYSVAGKAAAGGVLMRERPFRSPHHSASIPALIGGGSDCILPGEISLAHNGVLFMDEFCEAPKRVVEALRAPMEDRLVTISRLKSKVSYPASFMLMAATNPCPCGYWGDGDRCTCTPSRREAYLAKLSGPVVDRLDLHIWMRPVEAEKLAGGRKGEPSSAVAARVRAARDIQIERFRGLGIYTNAEMGSRQIERFCRLEAAESAYMKRTVENLGLSARAWSRILKISRTIADLSSSPDIRIEHLSEAVGYRFLDKRRR